MKQDDDGETVADDKRASGLTRRRLLIGGALAGGALLVGYVATHPMETAGALLSAGGRDFEPGPFGPYIRIESDGRVGIVNPQQEMGQGIHAGLAAIVAEELDADWDKVEILPAPVDFSAYGPQLTGGSQGIATHWDKLRRTGAAARTMFVAAAASRWGVGQGEISVSNGVVSHPSSARRATFGDLLADAARQTPPQEPTLKRPEQFTLIGTPRVQRKDSLPKSTGAQTYTQDVQLPDMLVAVVAHSPRFGGKLARFDDRDARRVTGVVDVFAIETGVAVLARNTAAALKGRDALRVEWEKAEAEHRSSAEISTWYAELAAGEAQGEVEPLVFESRGNAEAPQHRGAFETTIDFPYLAHAPMETLDCVAQVDGTRVTMWSGAHHATADRVLAAFNARTLPGRVDLNVLMAGGSFGRRGALSSDYLVECMRIARRVESRPVKLFWTREDEMAAGYYRPLAHHRVAVALDDDGFPADWRHHIVSQSLLPVGGNAEACEGVAGSPYFTTASTVDCRVTSPDLGIPVTFWRSVGHSHTAMTMEHVVDQLAARAGRDPADYRRELYRRAGADRRLGVLEEACAKSGWGTPLEDGWARGLAVHECFGSFVAQVAEVRLTEGRPIVRRVVAAVDCGIAISPDQIAAQVEGGIGFGLSAALYGCITINDGQVQQSNFDDYPVVRMNEMPAIETHILPSAELPTGMGEPGVAPIAPAVANAMFALSGRPVRSLPLLRGTTANLLPAID
ncbi:isoquinoline 1-oxidoreductase beta subunit [Sphingobium sp. OAS761]|nr:isoquinoline 1-oxidoreductase beta subunit [Sphingobium sp. OAS761]